MDICVLPILCWVALAPHSQEPMAKHLEEGNATGPASEAEESLLGFEHWDLFGNIEG